MLARPLSALVTAGLIWCGAADGKELAWITSREQYDAVSHLAAGYAGALRCNRLIDTAVAGRFLAQMFPNRPFATGEIAELMNLIIGTQAVQASLPGFQPNCAAVSKAFGPRGATIPGLMD
jgi:hypothetical protein